MRLTVALVAAAVLALVVFAVPARRGSVCFVRCGSQSSSVSESVSMVLLGAGLLGTSFAARRLSKAQQ